MKKFITLLLASSLAFAAGAGAKDDKKAAAKSRPAPQPKPQHVNAAPKTTAPKTHVKTAPQPKTQHVDAAPKVHHEHGPKSKDLPQSTSVQPKEMKPNKAPRLESDKMPRPVTADTAANTNNLRKMEKKTAALPKERIDQIRAQHRNFSARPSAAIASAQFNQNYQIAGARNWTGPQYQAFVNYRPQWHDSGWWQGRYGANVLLIAGGWYYWDSGYWYPAWGYDSAAAYYPYDGPIYVGENRVPFDQVVADCQATLQEQGYYRGEVDGLMGPLTRQALSDFQRDNGLVTTAAIDQPTLATLGLG
jgi:hypothetical protein